MKRKRLLWIITGLVLLAVAVTLSLGPADDSGTPRFVAGAPRAVAPYRWNHYNWSADAPFEDGKMWLSTTSSTNIHSYLYDLEQRKILGELFHAGDPELTTRGGYRILCRGRDSLGSVLQQRWRKKLDALCDSMGWKKLPLPPAQRTESFWILDTRTNRARRVGSVSQYAGTGSRWHPSPNFRYGYTRPSTAFGSWFVLCDLEEETFTQISLAGDLKGWWDDRSIVVNTSRGTFELFDILTHKTTPLFSPSFIQSTLTRLGLPNDPGAINTFVNWNGHDYDFYFAINEAIPGLKGRDSFLLKADRSGPTLNLVFPSFDFRWSGVLDPKGSYYVYQGESGAPGSGGDGGVFCRRLPDGVVSTVVPPDNKGQYSIPRLYRDEVIYFRERRLHRIHLDGTHDELLLPFESPLEN